jgi:hypothetical protein
VNFIVRVARKHVLYRDFSHGKVGGETIPRAHGDADITIGDNAQESIVHIYDR